jgi:HrpA-like RNA helicase
MAREWDTICLICTDAFSFSDTSYRKLLRRGQLLPQTCPRCEAEFLRERRTLGRIRADLGDVSPEKLRELAIGELGILPANVVSQYFESALEEHRANFGVSDERLLEFYQKLDDPRVQVIMVEAPTGAGKSTFFPYRLLAPPPGIEDPDMFTRNGQIVVTQPRVQATIGIPNFVKLLHGCRLGAGFDIGRKWSKENATDWNCKLVYLIDGTLINWIAGGLMANVSLIMLDEAHERSMNIDLIIGLLTKMLPRYPWLKLVIASATIDKDKFLRFFSKHLRGGTRCEHIVFEGKPGMPVRKHFRCGHVEWEDEHGNPQVGDPERPQSELPYDQDDLKPLLSNITKDVANKCVEILERMHPSDDTRQRNIPGDLADKQGDVLGFLLGQKSIEEAVSEIRQRVQKNPVLKACVQVLPFYSELPIEEQAKVIAVGKNPPAGITSVIIATNAAETSLTLKGVKHVVETGLINRSNWDTETETAAVKKFIHSQSGCRQRWGRAGRVADGDAWPLYTKKQFDRFPRDTPPAILCSRLEPAVLTAKSAGVDRLEPACFPWLDAPPPEELKRAILRLTQLGALDQHGDLTPLGMEIQKLGDDPRYASLLIMADRFACAVEMATVLPLLNTGRHRLLLSNPQWDATTKQLVDRVHEALISGCRDDLELVLKVFSAWRRSRRGGAMITGNWAWREIWKNHRQQRPLTEESRTLLGAEAESLERAVAGVTSLEQFEALRQTYAQRSPLLRDWLRSQQEAFQSAACETWAKLWLVNHDLLVEIETARDERIDRLAVRKNEKERRTINFEALDRVRAMLIWAAPDLCFLRSSEKFGGALRFDRLTDLQEKQRRLETSPDENLGDSLIESDEGDEDQWARPALMLEMSDKSVCRNEQPAAFVALGLQQNKQRRTPNSHERQFINVTFVVKIEPDWALDVVGLDAAGLAVYLARNFPPRPVADDDSEVSPIQERLFLDQRYPIFSQFRYKLIEQIDDRQWTVELVEPVAIWPESRAIEPQLRDDAEPAAEDEEEVRVSQSPEDLETIYGDGDKVAIDRAAEVEADDPHDSDVEDGEPEEESQVSENAKPSDPAHASLQANAEAPKSADPGTLPTAAEEPSDTPDWIPEMAELKWPPTEVILRLNRDTLPNEPIAEVTEFKFENKDDPLGCRSKLILETPTPEICYRLFEEQFQLGDTVTFNVVSKRKASNSSDLMLLVHEPETGMEIEVAPHELAFIRMADVAESYEAGKAVELVVVGMVPKHFRVQVSALPIIEQMHAHICEAGFGTAPETRLAVSLGPRGSTADFRQQFPGFSRPIAVGAIHAPAAEGLAGGRAGSGTQTPTQRVISEIAFVQRAAGGPALRISVSPRAARPWADHAPGRAAAKWPGPRPLRQDAAGLRHHGDD